MTVGALRTPLALLVELAWSFAAVAIFVQVFGARDGPAPSLAAVAVFVVGPFALARLLQRSALDEKALRITGVAITLIVVAVTLRLEYAHTAPWDPGWLVHLFTDTRDTVHGNAHVIAGVIAMLPLWLRGTIRGQLSDLDFEGVLGSASIGFPVVAIAALSDPPAHGPVSWGGLAFAYVALVLAALALFRAPDPAASAFSFGRRSSGGLLALAVAAAGLALAAAAFDPGIFRLLAPLGGPLAVAGNALGAWVLQPILAAIFFPFHLLGSLLGDFLQPRLTPPQVRPGENPVIKQVQDSSQPVWLRALLIVAGTIGLAAAIIGAIIILWFAFRRFARTRRTALERREEIEGTSSLTADLGLLLGALARRFGRRAPAPGSGVLVRRLYRDLLVAAAERGLERPVAATPSQFAPRLDSQFASPLPSSISAAFIESRYGERAIDPQRARDLLARWRALRESEAGPAASLGDVPGP